MKQIRRGICVWAGLGVAGTAEAVVWPAADPRSVGLETDPGTSGLWFIVGVVGVAVLALRLRSLVTGRFRRRSWTLHLAVGQSCTLRMTGPSTLTVGVIEGIVHLRGGPEASSWPCVLGPGDRLSLAGGARSSRWSGPRPGIFSG